MVIPIIIAGARAVGAVGRGIGSAGRSIKNHPVTQSVIQHPITQNIVQHPISQGVGRGVRGVGKMGLAGVGLGVAGAGMMGRLAIGSTRLGARAIGKTASAGILLFPILLWLFDFFIAGVNGVDLNIILGGGVDIVLKTIQGEIFLTFIVIYFIFKGRPQTAQAFIFPIAFIFLFALMWSLGKANLWVFIHLVFAFFVFTFLLKGFDKGTEVGTSHMVFLFVMAWDIFAFPSLAFFIPDNSGVIGIQFLDVLSNKLLFPIWIFYFFTFIEDSGIKKTLVSVLWIFYLGLFGFQAYDIYGEVLVETSGEEREAVLAAPKTFLATYSGLIKGWFTSQLQYAITGKVEENQFEPLGVYLENVQSADPRYYEDEDVIIWGSVTARTLDDPINIKVGCFVERDNYKLHADKVDPEKKFSVFTLEESDFACTFDETSVERGVLKTGSNRIKTFAEFNFETLAFLKVYFINRERQRAMAREGIDVFDEFAIADRNPVAVYTNGPAKIEMGTTSPLIGVSKDYIVRPSLDIKIDNREGWQGRINKLNELVLFLPEGIGFDPATSCNKRFVNYGLDTCDADEDPILDNCCKKDDKNCITCTDSCENFVKNECLDVCDGFINYNEGYGDCVSECSGEQKCIASCGVPVTTCNSKCAEDLFGDDCINCKRGLAIGSYNSCADTCIERNETCVETCDSFFVEGGQRYNGYALDVNDIKYRDESKDFEKGKLFRCRFEPDPSVVLGNAPITTKSFRVKVRYNYTVEKSVSVTIDKLPEKVEGDEGFVGPPLNLRGHAESGNMIIEWDLSINDGSGSKDIVGYRIYRKESLEAEWSKIGEALAGSTQFTDNGISLPAGTFLVGDFEYYYHVETVNKDGNWEKTDKMLGVIPPDTVDNTLDLPEENGVLA